LVLAFPAPLRRLAPQQRRELQQARREEPARLVRPLASVHRQQADRLGKRLRRADRRVRTPQQQQVHAELAAGRMRQLLQVHARAHHQQKRREAQEADTRRQLHQVAAARRDRSPKTSELARKQLRRLAATKLARVRKPGELHQKPRAPVKRQLDHIAGEAELMKRPPHQKNRSRNNKSATSRT